MVVPDPQLALGADHPGRDVAVGLARTDGERPHRGGEHAAGQDDDDEVPGIEVVRTAHDTLGLSGAVGVTDVDGAPVDRLAVLLRLGGLGQHPADDEGAGDTTGVQALLLETHAHEVGGDLLTRGVVGNRGVLAQPVDGNAHQISIPNCASKRTSPSIMSRMSLTPVRNIRARSIPMPNANPV